ncbi:hypothetical protein MJO28_005145 [Puccinia striiformis f. sp. tritici]|uniref:Uncharacterized protein n=1 Tax=Puccinia striiformis f. sp. tritici TaxID=168172 RepID=A0ACC0EJW5_9BASI|nr:hypothetical protein MJO28_005145 [Puccinia striiformis f. sp. tritici]
MNAVPAGVSDTLKAFRFGGPEAGRAGLCSASPPVPNPTGHAHLTKLNTSKRPTSLCLSSQ